VLRYGEAALGEVLEVIDEVEDLQAPRLV